VDGGGVGVEIQLVAVQRSDVVFWHKVGGAPSQAGAGQWAVRVFGSVGAAALLSSLPPAKALLADRGHDADWLRDALAGRTI